MVVNVKLGGDMNGGGGGGVLWGGGVMGWG